MIVNKPSILIYTIDPDEIILKEICAGIEEEGVLFEIVGKSEGDLDTLSYESANNSVLGSGIGIYKKDTAMQLGTVKKGKNVFQIRNPDKIQCRCLGANAARAVKKIPFKNL